MAKELLFLALMGFSISQALITDTKTADLDLLHKQKKIYELFLFIDQTKCIDCEWYEVGRNFDIESNIDLYKDKVIVKEFLYRFRLGMLRRDALFTVFREEHREELRVLIRLLLSAKDFITFYKTACWCRLYLNKGMFITALTTVCMYREDCKKIILPPIYEVYPFLFFDNEIIDEAKRIKMMTGVKTTMRTDDIDTHIIDRNLTTMMMLREMDKEYRLDYFMNDVELNNYYFYIRNLFPFWITLKHLDVPKHLRGEMYYFIHQQLLARYKLERWSVGLDEIELLDVDKKIVPSFISTLVHRNGVAAPSRDRWTTIPIYKTEYVKEIKIIEKRILDAIDSGLLLDRDGKQISLYTTEGLNLLGNLIEGNLDSCNTRLYGSIEVLFRNLLGVNYDCKHKNCVIPSVLETFNASLRDPVFYRLYKIILDFFRRFKCNLPNYTTTDLDFNGVIIEDVKVDKLMTYMDKCEYSINNVLTIDRLKEGLKWDIRTRNMCLKHKPFTWNILIKSDRNVKGIVRIFLGPTCDDTVDKRVCLNTKWFDFVELDRFTTDLTVGINTIRRLNTECLSCTAKMTDVNTLYKKVLKSIEGVEPFTMRDKIIGFPTHLYLPRGRVGGMPFKLFITITPIDESKITVINLPMIGKMLLDGKPLGFPLDRPIMPWLVDLKNVWLRDIWIHHVTDINDVRAMLLRRDDKTILRDVLENKNMNIRDTLREDRWMTRDTLKDDTIV